MAVLDGNWSGREEDKDIRMNEGVETLLLQLEGCWPTFADDQKICPEKDEKMAASE